MFTNATLIFEGRPFKLHPWRLRPGQADTKSPLATLNNGAFVWSVDANCCKSVIKCVFVFKSIGERLGVHALSNC